MARAVVTAGCGGCDRRWTSLTDHHCVACHSQFDCIEGFDAHRSRGKCHAPKAGLTYRRSKDNEGNVLWVLKS